MIDYKITLTTDGEHAVEFFTYDEEEILKEDKNFRLTKIKSTNKTLMPATTVRIFAPNDLEIIDVNEYGIFLGHKNEEKSAKE